MGTEEREPQEWGQGPSGTGTINHHKQRLDTTGDKDAPNHWGQMPPGRGDTPQPCSLPAAMEGFHLRAGEHIPAALGSPWDRATPTPTPPG